ncbi:MAG: stage II sporulation protein M [Pseudomonadota bacterium]
MNAPLPPAAGLRSARFRAEREEGWTRLAELVGQVERRGAQSLSFREAQELATLYRQAMTSLSLARAISLDKSLLAFLESLCARAYLAVYAPQESLSGLVSRVYLRGIPQAARRSALPLFIAFLALFLGGLLGYLLFLGDPTWYNTFMPPGLAGGRGLSSSREDLLSVIYQDESMRLDSLTAFASYLFSHNTQIAIFVFSLGVLACLPSFVLTFYNGLLLGAFLALHASRDLTYDITAWLSIHGVTELGAIVVACGAGFRLGLAVLFPGQRTRKDALHYHGRDAVKLAILAATMLVVAAILEGYFRQTVQDPGLRLTIGWGIGALWVAYLTLAGRERP